MNERERERGGGREAQIAMICNELSKIEDQ